MPLLIEWPPIAVCEIHLCMLSCLLYWCGSGSVGGGGCRRGWVGGDGGVGVGGDVGIGDDGGGGGEGGTTPLTGCVLLALLADVFKSVAN